MSGKRDSNGEIIKAKVVLISELSLSLNVAEASQPNCAFKEEKCREQTDVGQPQVTEYKEAVLMNWMLPSVCKSSPWDRKKTETGLDWTD
jgi:hypothetical protein